MLGALVTSVQEEKVHLESELAVSALPVLPVLVTSQGSWGRICYYALWEVLRTGVGLKQVLGISFPLDLRVIILSWDSTKGSPFAVKTVFSVKQEPNLWH